jgi:ubiquinone/menaquinone biosynthesis C-methylase UbiE
MTPQREAPQNVARPAAEVVDYDPFAELPISREIVRFFTQEVGIRPGNTVLDVGAGTGDSAAAILECLRTPTGCEGRVTLLEPEDRLLRVAQERLKDAPVDCIQGYAQDLDEMNLEEGAFDFTVWSNGIHYVEEEEVLNEVLRSIRRCTRHRFCAWTTFMSEAYTGRTARFAGLWVLSAYRHLGIDPKRERTKSESMQTRGSAEYEAVLTRAGFKDVATRLETFHLPPEVYESIARFGDYVENALPAIPGHPEITLAMRSQALVDAVRDVYKRLKVETLPRNWLYIEASSE